MGKHRQEKLCSKILITVAAVLLLAYTGVAWYMQHLFSYGTRINTVNASFLTVEEVKERLLEGLSGYTLTIQAKDGEEAVISGEEIGLTYDFGEDLDHILEGQNAFAWLPALVSAPVHYEVTPKAVYDETKLEQALQEIAFLDPANMTAPVNASISYSDADGFLFQPSSEGTTIDEARFQEALQTAFAGEETVLSLAEADCYTLPTVTEDSPQIKEVTDRLAALSDFTISYAFGENKEVIDRTVLWSWYRQKKDGTLYLDEKAVAAYVKTLAEKYDTVGGKRMFHTTDGRDIEVSGGPYGWKISQKKETEELLTLVKAGKDVADRQPVYAQTGFEQVRGTSDIGATYIEISIEAQHMWYYEDGQLYMDTDVVTGKGGNHTKRGVGYIHNKARNATLVGADYVSFVKYWMKVWGGIGIHDASWRSQFGGKIYLTSGSRGCINTPLDNVIKLYNRVKIGTPMVIY